MTAGGPPCSCACRTTRSPGTVHPAGPRRDRCAALVAPDPQVRRHPARDRRQQPVGPGPPRTRRACNRQPSRPGPRLTPPSAHHSVLPLRMGAGRTSRRSAGPDPRGAHPFLCARHRRAAAPRAGSGLAVAGTHRADRGHLARRPPAGHARHQKPVLPGNRRPRRGSSQRHAQGQRRRPGSNGSRPGASRRPTANRAQRTTRRKPADGPGHTPSDGRPPVPRRARARRTSRIASRRRSRQPAHGPPNLPTKTHRKA